MQVRGSLLPAWGRQVAVVMLVPRMLAQFIGRDLRLQAAQRMLA